MQASRLPVLAPLSVSAPPLLRRRSSALSKDAPSLPRTPTCGSPIPFLLSNANNNNRKSSDSWNSWEEGDDMEWDWLPEHLLLLTRALDALPAHVLTPFNGMPPANLLDKLARGVTSAKGPAEWPHSVRATRLKLLELSRVRAKEVAHEESLQGIIQEDCRDCVEGCSHGRRSQNGRRPLYRQSSMDFVRNASLEAKNSDTIARLSSRLQRAERAVPGSPHRFRPESPLSRQYPILNPSTPSSTTLNSTSTHTSRIPVRPTSTLTNSSDMSADSYTGAPMLDPRVQRIRRSGSFGSMPVQSDTSPKRQRNVKRAPSYGSNSSGSTRIDSDPFIRHRKDSSGSTHSSSDEEEKARTKQAKKARRKSPPPTELPSPQPAPKAKTASKKKLELGAALGRAPAEPAAGGVRRPRANHQRNLSIFGPELPPLAAPEALSGCPSAFRAHTPGGAALLPGPALPPLKSRLPKRERRLSIATPPADTPLLSPTSPPRLRRMKGTTFSPSPPVRALTAAGGPSRRISFGSAASPTEENATGAPLGLQSAFQLH